MTDETRREIAEKFGQTIDPLEQYDQKFRELEKDSFEPFFENDLEPSGPADDTIRGYERVIQQWKGFMDEQGRQPTCPNEDHVKRFLEIELEERDNAPRTAKKKLTRLNRIYRYWQDDSVFPHSVDYNPFKLAERQVDLSTGRVKEPPRISLDRLREILADVDHIFDQAIIAVQLKLGLRASEVANIKISEINIRQQEVQEHYDRMGSAPRVSEYDDAVYIPHDRSGNKSKRPRVLPIDDELRRILIRYLLIRPDNGEPWLFLSQRSNTQTDDEVMNTAWKRHFRPEYDETEQHQGVTSHFGRHRFTTFWRVQEDMNRELIRYMRGDTVGTSGWESAGGIDYYIHSYYEDVESEYRDRIFKLGL